MQSLQLRRCGVSYGVRHVFAGVLEKACEMLLRNLTQANNADNRAKCGAAGGVEVVLDILRHHNDGPAAGALLEDACWALWNMTVNNADSKGRCVAAGGSARP